MHIHQLPGRSQNHVDAISRVIYEVSEDYGQALECISFDVEEFLCVRLNHLKKNRHPLIETILQAIVNKFVIDTVGPADASKAEVENMKYLFAAVIADLLIREGRQDRL